MPSGGPRRAGPGKRMGRPPNRPNKVSEARASEAKQSGRMLPADGLLLIFEQFMGLVTFYQPRRRDPETGLMVPNPEHNFDRFVGALRDARVAARDAAPYYHHRLSAITVHLKRANLEKISDADLEQLERIAAELAQREGDVAGGNDGTVPTSEYPIGPSRH